jgi:hypothetical protein
MILLALVVGIVAAVIAPWLIARIGMARVVLSEKGINHNVMRGIGWQINFYPWESIRAANLSEVGGQPVLNIELKSGAKVVVARADTPSSAEIEAHIARYSTSA